uniref:SRA1/Sec31 domain-containing protein n=1 Tax=Neogobius melanostomus TaxID=47308 RepID=A0A8C6T088_9GOBI
MGSNAEEDLFIKPGNQERGWNDPPQFSYGLQNRGAHRNILTRRAPPAGTTARRTCGSGIKGGTVAYSDGISTKRGKKVGSPPLPSVATASGPIRAQSESVQSEPEPDVEEVMSVLNGALEACRQNTKYTSVSKTPLSRTPLRSFTSVCLSSDLKSGLWDAADDTHRSLMVDRVTEVSQWMVGIKRLIAETRKLTPPFSFFCQNSGNN